MSKKRRGKSLSQTFVDDGVYLMGFFGVIVLWPQLQKIYVGKNVAGLSLISWVGMTLGSFLLIIYASIHKQTPLIVTNLMIAALQIAIVVGIMMYS